MKLTSNELLIIATALGKEIEEIQWKESNVQLAEMKGEMTKDEKERKYNFLRERELELSKLREKVFDIEFNTHLEEAYGS